jgi:hypothetical protein
MVATTAGIRGNRPQTDNNAPRRKRSDTHVGTIEREYGLDFGVRSDMHLGTLLQRRNADWLSALRQEDVDQNGDLDPECPE